MMFGILEFLFGHLVSTVWKLLILKVKDFFSQMGEEKREWLERAIVFQGQLIEAEA